VTKNLMTVAALAFTMTGCGQKKESISFDEALKKDLLSFEYRMIECDRGPKGLIVRISAKRHDGKDVALEAEMDDSRVYNGTAFVRGRDSFTYGTSDVVRHVAPRLKEMLRRKAGE